MDANVLNNRSKVRKELDRLLATQTRLIVRHAEGTSWCCVESIMEEDGVIVLRREDNFKVHEDMCTFVYSPGNNFWKGFVVPVLFENAESVGVGFPETIKIIKQMRTNHRFTVSDRCIASFSRQDGRIIYSGRLVDISKSGAKIAGDFSGNIVVGSILTNITMTLRLIYGNFEEVVIAHDAIVRWTKIRGRCVLELGIEFSLTKPQLNNLDVFLAVAQLVPEHLR